MAKWSICRICLKDPGRIMQNIFTEETGQQHLVEKIEECGGVQVDKSMDMPNCICEKCLLLLKVAYKFRETCQRSDKQLRKLFKLCSDSSGIQNVEEANEKEEISHQKPISVKKNIETGKNNRTTIKNSESLDFAVNDALGETLAELQNESIEFYEDVAHQTKEETAYTDNKLQTRDDDAEDDKESSGMECCSEQEDNEEENEKKHERGLISANNDIKLIAVTSQNDANIMSSEYKIVTKFTSTRSNHNLQQPKAKNSKTSVITAQKSRKSMKQKKDDKFICAVCGNIYPDKTKLNMHLKIHNKVKPHECEICHKRFAQTPQLARHMNTHTGNRPYKCIYCPSSFADPSTLCKHERIHTNERPYKCDACGKMFAYTNVLKVHMMMHSGEKPHQCTHCGKKFSQLHHMRTHERIHINQSGQGVQQ